MSNCFISSRLKTTSRFGRKARSAWPTKRVPNDPEPPVMRIDWSSSIRGRADWEALSGSAADLIIGAHVHDTPLVEAVDAIAVLHRAQAVGDDDQRLVSA